MNVNPKVLQQVSQALPYVRVKSRLKKPRSTLGKSVKDLLAKAGKRRLNHEKPPVKQDGEPSLSDSRNSIYKSNGISPSNSFYKYNQIRPQRSTGRSVLQIISEESSENAFNESPIKKLDLGIVGGLQTSTRFSDYDYEEDINEFGFTSTSLTFTSRTRSKTSRSKSKSMKGDYYRKRDPLVKQKKGSIRVKRKPNPAFVEEQLELNTGIEMEYEYSYEEDEDEVFFLGVPADGVFASDSDGWGYKPRQYDKNKIVLDPTMYQVISTMNHPDKNSESVLVTETSLLESQNHEEKSYEKLKKHKSKYIIYSDDESDSYKNKKQTKEAKKPEIKNNIPKTPQPKTKPNTEVKSKPKNNSSFTPKKGKFIDDFDDDHYEFKPLKRNSAGKNKYNANNKFLKDD